MAFQLYEIGGCMHVINTAVVSSAMIYMLLKQVIFGPDHNGPDRTSYAKIRTYGPDQIILLAVTT